jgi:hypothetical protein
MDGSWEFYVPFFPTFFPSVSDFTLAPIPSNYERGSTAKSLIALCQLFAPHMASHWDVTSLSPASSFTISQASGSWPPTRHHHVQCTAVAQTIFMMLCIPNFPVICQMAHDRFVVTPLPPAFSFFPSPTGLYTSFCFSTTDTTWPTTPPL